MQTLLLLPGWTRNGKSYQKLLQTAPCDVHVEVFDYHDVFSKAKRPNLAHAIMDVVHRKQYGTITLAGHSLGGAFAIDFASQFQNNIDQLYLIDSEGVHVQASISSQFYSMIHNHTIHGRKKILTNYQSLQRILRRPILHYRLAKFAYQADFLSEAQQIKISTTILWGDKDLVTTVEQARILSSHIANSKLKIFEGLDHDWLLHNPKKFWEEFNR